MNELQKRLQVHGGRNVVVFFMVFFLSFDYFDLFVLQFSHGEMQFLILC